MTYKELASPALTRLNSGIAMRENCTTWETFYFHLCCPQQQQWSNIFHWNGLSWKHNERVR